MKTILVLLDTVRKDYLSVYNPATDVQTPNIDCFAQDSYVFENHFTGSMPCMPARRDLFTGRLDFLERFWGGIEPFDVVLQKELSLNNVKTHIVTDHQHYWKFGGEGYLQYFDTMQTFRGQESDGWISAIDSYEAPTDVHGRLNLQFEYNKTKFNSIDQYPTAQTFNSAAEFIRENAHKESFFLQVEGFDPHEPFESPQQFMDLYDLSEDDIAEFYNSPQYGPLNDSAEQLKYIIQKYKANLSFADYCFGNLIATLKELNIYDECNIIFTSDHGFHLGDHGYMGKGVTHLYNEICQIPLLHKPSNNKINKRIDLYTQNIDLMPTLLDMYNIDGDYNFHGKSYAPLFAGLPVAKNDAIISGYHGQSIRITDQTHTLFVGPTNEFNMPLFNYTAIPTMIKGYIGSKYSLVPLDPNLIETGRFLKHTNYPVFKIPFASPTRKNPLVGSIFGSELYENKDDLQINQLQNEEIRELLKNKLVKLMEKYQAPSEQYIRLGLKTEIDA